MDRLRIEWQRLADRIDEFSLRERGMIFVGVLAVMYFITTQFVIAPLAGQRGRLQQDLQNKHNQIQAAERQIQAMLSGEVVEGDPAKRARLDQLREQTKVFDAELGKTTSGLVTPKEMVRMVEQFLANNRGLEVVKVENLPPELLVGDTVKAGAGGGVPAASAERGAVVYKQGLRVELRGSWDGMLAYLRGLEALPWRVFWGQVTLQTEQYPISKMTLVIYTLSTSESWMGI